jgi:hypothetical protein
MNNEDYSVSQIRELVQYAKTKLLAPEYVPMQLKSTAYIRLCSKAISKLPLTSSIPYQLNQLGIYQPYFSPLLEILAKCNQQWWLSCKISEFGILYSHEPAIESLLEPLAMLAIKESANKTVENKNLLHKLSETSLMAMSDIS